MFWKGTQMIDIIVGIITGCATSAIGFMFGLRSGKTQGILEAYEYWYHTRPDNRRQENRT